MAKLVVKKRWEYLLGRVARLHSRNHIHSNRYALDSCYDHLLSKYPSLRRQDHWSRIQVEANNCMFVGSAQETFEKGRLQTVQLKEGEEPSTPPAPHKCPAPQKPNPKGMFFDIQEQKLQSFEYIF